MSEGSSLKEAQAELARRVAAAANARMKASQTRAKASRALARDARAIRDMADAETRLRQQQLLVDEAERVAALSTSTTHMPRSLPQHRVPTPHGTRFQGLRRPRDDVAAPFSDDGGEGTSRGTSSSKRMRREGVNPNPNLPAALSLINPNPKPPVALSLANPNPNPPDSPSDTHSSSPSSGNPSQSEYDPKDDSDSSSASVSVLATLAYD